MKWAIYILIFIITIATASALPMCSDLIELNQDCQMNTPALSCDLYNYSIFNSENGTAAVTGNLTNLVSNIYYYNQTLPRGDYIVYLCDESVQFIKVTKVEDNMLAIIIGMGIIIAFLIGIGYLNLKLTDNKIGFWLGVLGLSLGIIEIITMFGFLYAREAGIDITRLMAVNFWSILILGFGLAIASMTLLVFKFMDFSKDDSNKKWSKKW